MSDQIKFTDGLLSLKVQDGRGETRVFMPSRNINVFPCSRRGQNTEGIKQYDPEARLNTERTNRLRTSINGFTDSFIDSFTKDKDENNNELETGTLVFVLAGYRIEVKDFNPADIAKALSASNKIYAHLSIQADVPLSGNNYHTEILYKQSTIGSVYIDVKYNDEKGQSDYFFMGVSFTQESESMDYYIDGKLLESANLPLFSKNADENWELVQTSLRPKIAHGETEGSIKINGDFTVEHDGQRSFEIIKSGKDADTPLGVINTILRVNNVVHADCLFVGEDFADKDGTEPQIVNGIITAEKAVKTPIIDVKIIENTQDTTGVKIEDNLNVTAGHAIAADTLKVNTVRSRQENGTITVESPTQLSSTLTVIGEATLSDNLKVEDNINVGNLTDTEKETANNGGCIVAKKNIIAKENLEASKNIYARENIIADGNLTVGTEGDASTGTITAKKLEATTEVVTPTLRVNRLTTNSGSITVDDKSLVVTKSLEVLATKPIAIFNPEAITEVITSCTEPVALSKQTGITGIKIGGSATVEDYKVAVENGALTFTNNGANTYTQLTLYLDSAVFTEAAEYDIKLTYKLSEGFTSTDTNSKERAVIARFLKGTSLSGDVNIVTKSDLEANDYTEWTTTMVAKTPTKVPTALAIIIFANPRDKITIQSLEISLATDPATATIDKAIIGNLVVQKDNTNLTKSTGTVTAKEVVAEKITQNGNAIPSIKLVPVSNGTTHQLQIILDASKNSKKES